MNEKIESLLQMESTTAFGELIKQLLQLKNVAAALPEIETRLEAWPTNIPRHIPDALFEACVGTPLYRLTLPLDVASMSEASRRLAPTDFGDGDFGMREFAAHLDAMGLKPVEVVLEAGDLESFFPKSAGPRYGKVTPHANYCFHHGSLELRGDVSVCESGGRQTGWLPYLNADFLVLTHDLRGDGAFTNCGLGVGELLEAPSIRIEGRAAIQAVRGQHVVLATGESLVRGDVPAVPPD
jgi:hypothetical protein